MIRMDFIFPHILTTNMPFNQKIIRRVLSHIILLETICNFTATYFPIMKKLRTRTAGYLSGGEQQMLVIGRALMAQPRLMLLDEPSMGLAPLIIKEIFNVLGMLNHKENITMLLVEQNVRIALSIASYGYLMETGRIVLHGSSKELAENEDVKEFYLGLNLSGGRKSYRDVKHYKRRKRWLG